MTLEQYVASKLSCFYARAMRALDGDFGFFRAWQRWSDLGGDCCRLSERQR